MSTTLGVEEDGRLRRAEDAWLHQSAERLRRAARRQRVGVPADRPARTVATAGEGDGR